MSRRLSPEAIRFRELVINALWDPARLGYLDEDSFVGTCPICGAAVAVHFAGHASRAALKCHGGCTEAEVAAVVGLEVRP